VWQFLLDFCSEETMTRIIVFMDVFETIILVGTRFCNLSETGLYALGGFYVIEIILLILQLIFADLGISIKVKSIFFITLYVFLFAYDVLNINLIVLIIESKDFIYLDNFLKNTWFGELLSAIILAGFKILFAHWLKKENE
jgi:hypothetical protein